MTTTKTAAPYTARQCPDCNVWVYCGPRTKSTADFRHYEKHHMPEQINPNVVGIPYFMWNETPVEAVKA